MDRIILSKQNNLFSVEINDHAINFNNPNEFKFFGLQLLKDVHQERHIKFTCAIAWIISNEMFEDGYIDVSELFKSKPDRLDMLQVLSKCYSDNNFVADNLSCENQDLIFAMHKIVKIIVDLIDSLVLGNLDFGDNLFGTGSENLFFAMFQDKFINDLNEIQNKIRGY